jgi:hypothetical protein
LPADLIADDAADNGADREAANAVLAAADGSARGAAGDRAKNSAGALLIIRTAPGKRQGQRQNRNEGQSSHLFPLRRPVSEGFWGAYPSSQFVLKK